MKELIQTTLPARQNEYRKYWKNIKDLHLEYFQFKRAIEGMESEFAAIVYAFIEENFGVVKHPSILDLGCGDGRIPFQILAGLKCRIQRYLGIDLRPDLFLNLFLESSIISNKNVIAYDANSLTLDSNFDYIFAINSLYGINPSIVPKLVSSLTPKGVLIISLNSVNSLFYQSSKANRYLLFSAEELESTFHNSKLPFKRKVLKHSFERLVTDGYGHIWLKYLSLLRSGHKGFNLPQNILALPHIEHYYFLTKE